MTDTILYTQTKLQTLQTFQHMTRLYEKRINNRLMYLTDMAWEKIPELPQWNHLYFQECGLLLSIRNNFSLNAKRRRVVDISGRIQTKFLDTAKFLETELQKDKNISEHLYSVCTYGQEGGRKVQHSCWRTQTIITVNECGYCLVQSKNNTVNSPHSMLYYCRQINR